MVNSVTISAAQWQAALGEYLAPPDLEWLNQQVKLLKVEPGQLFWHSRNSPAGLQIVLVGKVRLFSEAGEKLAVISTTNSFGASTLFADQAAIYVAKAALVKGQSHTIIAQLTIATLQKLWQKSPKIKSHLLAQAQGALQPAERDLAGNNISIPVDRRIESVMMANFERAGGDRSQTSTELSQVYFPSPGQQLGQWWQRTTTAYPFYAQQSAADCGAACMVMIGRYWGKVLKINRVRDMAVISRDGSSLKTLAAAAESLGFNSRPVKASLDQLSQQKLPAIAHWRGNHYLVVYEITAKSVIVGDPAVGQRRLTPAEFSKDWTGYCLLLEPTVSLSQNSEPDAGTFWQLLDLVKPHRLVIGEIFVASIVLQIFGLISPIFTQLILDRAIIHKSVDSLTTFSIGLLIMAIFKIAMASLRQYLIYVTAIRIDTAMIVGFIRHAFSLPLNYFDTRQVGDITSRMQENYKIRSFITGETLGLLLDIMSVFVYVSLMFVYSWKLALLVLVTIPPFLILNVAATPFLKKISREVFTATTEENSYLIEALTGVRTVKSMAVEKTVRWRWEELLNQEIKQLYRSKMFSIKLQMASAALESFSGIALLWLGATLVISGEFSIGQMFAFNMLAANVISPFKRLAGLWNQFQEVTIAIERICDVIESPPEENLHDDHRQRLGKLRGQVVFDRVTFRYNPHTETNTLENLSFEITPGQTVALVGRSGSGKTTISKLLLGLYPPTTGKILIDGQELAGIALHSLRSQIGVVDQNTFLFSGSIADNITLGHAQATSKEVKQAAILAGADEFIRKMPMGYETQIGEGGGMLSGGQRQRLAIARALLGNPRLLVFDEATSSLDTESERLIQKNLETICQGRSTLIIAHRLSTVQKADLILVLDQGILIESGNHQELMAKRGQYFHLNEQQLTIMGS
jgi:HlyB family type I secretion system ABC transporter